MTELLEAEKNFYVQVAREAALEAGAVLRRNFNAFKVAVFQPQDGQALPDDSLSERLIVERLQTVVSDHTVKLEGDRVLGDGSDYVWHVDPLDGTSNYRAGIPYFSVTIALTFKDQMTLGVVYNPVTNQLFSCVRGEGASMNGRKISPSNPQSLQEAHVSFIRGLPRAEADPVEVQARRLEFFLRSNTKRTLHMWAPALDWCLVAGGGLHAVVAHQSPLASQLAGILMCMESGCAVTNFQGQPFTVGMTEAVSCHPDFHKGLLKTLSSKGIL